MCSSDLWIAEREEELGESFEIPPLTYSPTAEQSPMDTLAAMLRPDQEMVVVEVPTVCAECGTEGRELNDDGLCDRCRTPLRRN